MRTVRTIEDDSDENHEIGRRRLASRRAPRRNRLKAFLVLGDLVAIFSGYVLALRLTGFLRGHDPIDAVLITAFAVVAGFWCLRSQGLFLARVSAIRVVELTRAARAIVILEALVLLLDRVVQVQIRITAVTIASALALALLVLWRSIYRSWLSGARANGRYRRRVILIGTDSEAKRLVDLIATHDELGIEVVGLIGEAAAARRLGLGDLWLGETCDAERLIESADVSSVVACPQAIPAERLNVLIRQMQRAGIHIFVGTGFSGIDARRVRSMSLAYEPMLYVEAPSLGSVQKLAKRTFDIVMAVLGLLMASPIMLVVAAVIKLSDRGPVFFRQQRVGLGGLPFALFKFRTMVVDAEQRLSALESTNERNGPLFKMNADPRVTRIGRFLRESSLDELPQLFNVLKGQMSLVGPRPALPVEVAKFPESLRAREQVLPGITGLWQVEARDNPSFEAYRRLDLFYVENWSLTLDFLLIMGTIERLAARLITSVFGRRRNNRLTHSLDQTIRVADQPDASVRSIVLAPEISVEEPTAS